MKLKSEIYIIILWSEALYKKDKIIQDIKRKFEIIEIYEIEWSKNLFFENLFIFYNGELPLYSEKDKYSGDKPFYCLIVKDNNPKYIDIITNLGNKHIFNEKLYQAKKIYRYWTNNGHKIHSSQNKEETERQLKLLFNQSYNYFFQKKYNGQINKIKQNLVFNDNIIKNNYEEKK